MSGGVQHSNVSNITIILCYVIETVQDNSKFSWWPLSLSRQITWIFTCVSHGADNMCSCEYLFSCVLVDATTPTVSKSAKKEENVFINYSLKCLASLKY